MKYVTRNLIDQDDLIDSLDVSDWDIWAKEVIRDAPCIDAVEVVRCKDCVQWERFKNDATFHNGRCHTHLVELGKITKEEMWEELEKMHKIDMRQDEIDREIVELMREQYKINVKEV